MKTDDMRQPPCRNATDRSAKIGSVPDFMASLIKVGVTTVLTNKKSREEEINVPSQTGKGKLLTARISPQTMDATPIPQDTPLLPTTAIQTDATIKMNSLIARIHAPRENEGSNIAALVLIVIIVVVAIVIAIMILMMVEFGGGFGFHPLS